MAETKTLGPGPGLSNADIANTLQRAQAIHKECRAQEHKSPEQSAQAEALYRQVLTAQPNNATAAHYLGLLLNDIGRSSEADLLLKQSLELAPREPSFLSNWGNVLAARGQAAAAERPLHQALALQPHFPQAHFNLGMSLKSQKKREPAIAEFRIALSQHPRFVEAFVELARVLFEHDKETASEALALLDQAIAIDRGYSDAHFFRGHVLMHFGRYDEAIASFVQAARLFKSEVTLYELGNALSSAGRLEEAAAAFWASIQLKPEYIPSHYAYTQTAWTMGRSDVHFASYAYAREKIGENAKLLHSEASIRINLSDFGEAARLLGRASEMAPEDIEIAAELGRTLSLMSRHDEAIGTYEKVVKLAPESASLQSGYAGALLRAGAAARAIERLDEAHRLDPRDQTVLGALTAALRQTGDSRYAHLVDNDKYVRAYNLRVPAGFADADAFNTVLANELARLHVRKTEPFDQTLRGGTQTMGHLFKENSKLIGLVRESIEEAISSYIRDLPDDPSHPTANRKCENFTFNGSWSCRLRTAGYHTDHVHNMGWISSAYYVALPTAVSTGQHEGWLRFGCSAFNLNAIDTPDTYVRPVVGRLVLFPSFYWHGTEPFSSSDERMTVAFDVIPN